ncbi:MAG: serine/threonine protein kinase [Gemmatimonadota bacterium]|nr:MAG: serine/threonine protein kinase [Gemmatimonadota bacterium]
MALRTLELPNLSTSLDRLTAAFADRYTIERELGAGGMAIVYLARDLKQNRQVALRVLRPELVAILGADRFLKEIEVTANLQHPSILPLYDSGEADYILFYVMSYAEGESLRDKVNRETQLGIEEAVWIACEVADALEYAHRQKVIHRDIKPEARGLVRLHVEAEAVATFIVASYQGAIGVAKNALDQVTMMNLAKCSLLTHGNQFV